MCIIKCTRLEESVRNHVRLISKELFVTQKVSGIHSNSRLLTGDEIRDLVLRK